MLFLCLWCSLLLKFYHLMKKKKTWFIDGYIELQSAETLLAQFITVMIRIYDIYDILYWDCQSIKNLSN